MDDASLGKYGKVQRDPHGHLRLGEIEFGRIIKDHLTVKLEELGLKVSIIDKDLGYELRCADPIPFDAEYTRALGYGAVKFLQSEDSTRYGAVMSLVGGRLISQPFNEIMNPQTQRMLPRKVDVDGETYECARHYMIRLLESDFKSPEKLGRLANIVNMTSEQFTKRFGYLVGI
jgi:ATP-dependent phosphofructokinase / diphosphate-dependent phosphofructokinase